MLSSALNKVRHARKFSVRDIFWRRFQFRSNSTADYMRSNFNEIIIPNVNVVDFVTKDFGKWHDKVAVECATTGRKYTFDDLRFKSERLGRTFVEIFKLEKGDVVCCVLPNVPEYPVCVMGCLKAGLTITTVNPNYTVEEMKRQFIDADIKAVITLGKLIPQIKEVLKQSHKNVPVIAIKTIPAETLPGGVINFQQLLDTDVVCPKLNQVESDDIAAIPYSSGTTGLPKGVQLTNRNLVSNIAQYNYNAEPERENDILPCILPMFHIYGFTIQTLASLQCGIKLITLEKFDPELYMKTIANHKATALMLAPPVVHFLNSHPSVKREHLQSLRTVVCGAAPLGGADELTLQQKVGKPINILQGYGLTETSPMVLTVPAGKQKDGGMGYVTHNTQVKVVDVGDPTLKHLGPNRIGELLVKGPQVMRGYLNRPKETEEAFADGWLRTGDLVKYDDDGMFYIADRIKELIKTKGFQVAPAELELVIRQFPGIAEAAVIGVPHERYGEAPRAYVVLKPGSSVDIKKLSEFVQNQVAPYKKLEGGVSIVGEIPKNPSGKILRKKLKEGYENDGI